MYTYVITVFKQRTVFLFNFWNLEFLYNLDRINSNSKPMWGHLVITKSLVIFPTFSEPRPRQKISLPPSTNGRFFYFLVPQGSVLCAKIFSVPLVCQGLVFFPALPLKQKFLSFWDENNLQGGCSIKRVLLFISLLIFGSVRDFPYFHTLVVHLKECLCIFILCIYVYQSVWAAITIRHRLSSL